MITLDKLLKNAGKLLILSAVMANAQATVTDISQAPLVTSSSSNQPVKPNVFLMMDDSGSMGWDFMPDDVGGQGTNGGNFQNEYGFYSAQCNGVYYSPDPLITYTPPVKADGVTLYPDASFTTAPWDGYGKDKPVTTTTNLDTSFISSNYYNNNNYGGLAAARAFYYSYSGTQLTLAQKNYANTNSTFFKECNSFNSAPGNAVFTKHILGTTETTTIAISSSTANASFTITVTGTSSTGVSKVTVGGTTITSGSASGSTTNSTEAKNIAGIINAGGTYSATYTSNAGSVNTITVTGPATVGAAILVATSSGTDTFAYSAITALSVVSGITVNGTQLMLSGSPAISSSTSTTAANIAAKINATGYSATSSGGVVTITGPTTAADFTPVITYTGSMTLTTDVFPITTASALTRFANWYSYYRTRINMMKTSTGQAFKNIGNNYRVGFATMNNNSGTDFLNLASFLDSASPVKTQRTDFYAKLYGTSVGSSTPLLEALSNVGLMYAHKLPSNKLNSVTANDPIQYSCQQNFTILSTDGYWNDATNMTLKAQGAGSACSPTTSSVGNCDGTDNRPMYDGATVITHTATTTTTVVEATTVTPTTTTWPWTQTSTTVGAASSCTYTAALTPTHTTTAYLSDTSGTNKIKVAVGISTANPAVGGGSCTKLSTSGISNFAWICDGKPGTTAVNPPFSPGGPVTDSAGTTWNLVTSTAGNTGCTTDKTAFGGSYSSGQGACPTIPAVMGYSVSAQPQSATETASGTSSKVYDTTTTSTSTVTTINNLPGAPVITTTGPTQTLVSGPAIATTSDTGTPSSYSNNGSPTVSCSQTGTPGTTTSIPTKGGSTTTNGTSFTAASPVPVTTTTVGTPVVTTTSSGGTSNTLADVAEYYYITDIRDASLGNQIGVLGTDVSNNNVPTSGLDAASWQHMTTFTLGLGARGSMVFSPSYQTDSSGDYVSVKNGVLADPANGICSWQGKGSVCNWPFPVSGDPTTIDDLWHTAVDGRGSYYSASDPATLSTGLNTALAGVTTRTGSAASASVSNPNVATGDNFIFSSSFVSQDWYGTIVRRQLDLSTAQISSTIDWDAGALLDNNTARNIYAFSSIASNHLQPFSAANFGSNANFATANIGSLSQFCVTGTSCLTAAQQTAAAGANLVSYLAGDHTNEGYPGDPTKYYRQRVHVLGDIVDSQAAYVKKPSLLYSDAGYSDFVTYKANRQSMIYVGANDGMLHAFYANGGLMDNVTGDVVASGGVSVSGGQEAWAFIPAAVMPNLYKLADINYAGQHTYYVDSSPVTTDICPTAPALDCSGTTWKTILVEGLNAGGESFFAMDVTNPAAPRALWEFTNPNLGYSYGNPQVVKLGGTGTGSLATGTWVVLLTSGYNNGDGQGHLFVLNAYTGALLLDISTGVGSTSNPSGLSKIIAAVVNPSLDATVLQVYGGDLFGNVWRFDVNDNVGAYGADAQLLAILQGPTGLAQPITAKPEVGLVNGKTVVYVGTGRYLGSSDIDGTNTSQLSPNLQSIYGIMDPLDPNTTSSVAIYTNPRALMVTPPSPAIPYPLFVQQSVFSTTCPQGAPATVCTFGQVIRTSTNYAVSFPQNGGWYIDFPDSGERMDTDPALELGLLAFNTNTPSATACSVGGSSFNYVLDYSTGAFPANSIVTITAAIAATLPPDMVIHNADGTLAMGVAGIGNLAALSTGAVFVKLPNGDTALCTNDSSGVLNCRLVNPPPPAGGARRVSWRELLSQ